MAVTATQSNALGAEGGAVLGDEVLCENQVSTAGTFVFDTGLAPVPAAAVAEACRIIGAESERVAALHHAADRIAAAAGVQRAPGVVQPIPVGAAASAAGLLADGIVAGCFRPPACPTVSPGSG